MRKHRRKQRKNAAEKRARRGDYDIATPGQATEEFALDRNPQCHSNQDDGCATSTPHDCVHRCERCGCQLRRGNEEVFCDPCQNTMDRHLIPCSLCGTPITAMGATRCSKCEKMYQAQKRYCPVCKQYFLPYQCRECNVETYLCLSCHWKANHGGTMQENTCNVCKDSFLPRKCIVPECGVHLTGICPHCHESREHDGMRADVWTMEDCPRCMTVVDELKVMHRKVILHSLTKLRDGSEMDIDAMVALALADGVAPLVRIEDRFLEPSEVDALIRKAKG